MHQSFVTPALAPPRPTGIAGLMCEAMTFWVPPQYRVNAGLVILCKYTPVKFTLIKSRAMSLSRSLQCRAFSRAVMDEKSLSPLFPVDGEAVVTNDWCIIVIVILPCINVTSRIYYRSHRLTKTCLNHLMSKPTKWHVRPAKPQISLGIRPVWSEFSLSAWRNIWSLAIRWTHSEDPDQTGRMPRLIWVFAGRTLNLLVLPWGGSSLFHTQRPMFGT